MKTTNTTLVTEVAQLTAFSIQEHCLMEMDDQAREAALVLAVAFAIETFLWVSNRPNVAPSNAPGDRAQV